MGLTYDAAGNHTNDGGQNLTYDFTGQQAAASYSGYLLQQYYNVTDILFNDPESQGQEESETT